MTDVEFSRLEEGPLEPPPPRRGCCAWIASLLSAASLDISDEQERQARRQGADPGVRKVTLGRIVSEVKGEWQLFGIATAFSLVGGAAAQGTPYLTGLLLDALTEKCEFRYCLQLLGFMAAFTVAQVVCNFLQRNMFTYISFSVVKRLREQCLERLLHMGGGFFDSKKLGELISRMNGDSQKLQFALSMQAPNILRITSQALFAGTMMFYINPSLAALGLTATPLLGFLTVYYGRKIKKYQGHVQDLQAEAAGLATDIITNVRTIQSFGREELDQAIYFERSQATFEVRKRVTLMNSCHNGTTTLLNSTVDILVLAYAAWLVLVQHPGGGPGPLTIGLLITFRMYMSTCVNNVAGIARMYVALQKAIGGTEHFFSILDTPPEISYEGGHAPPMASQGQIEFNGVTFAYPSRPDKLILNSLSFATPAGKCIAFCGPTGSGKSSILKLLQRYYSLDGGTITLDGYPLHQLSLPWLRKQIGSVDQEPILFGRSIMENIRVGDPTASDLQVKQVALEANAASFIEELPEGYDTQAGERGSQLSGGQKQRIAIARAMLKNAPILLLDEATSALDTESEEVVSEALNVLMKGRTTMMIAHRMSTVASADLIMVIKHGSLDESGTHNELMAKQGLYYKLYTGQDVTALSGCAADCPKGDCPKGDCPPSKLSRANTK